MYQKLFMKNNLAVAGILLVLVGGALFLSTKSTTPQYNVIIVAFDGLQAKHLSEYGYDKDYTPNLDTFFKTAYTFTNTVSAAPWRSR